MKNIMKVAQISTFIFIPDSWNFSTIDLTKLLVLLMFVRFIILIFLFVVNRLFPIFVFNEKPQ